MSRRLAAIVFLTLVAGPGRAEGPFRYPEGKHGKGELKYRNGVPLLVAVGTPEEMGEQIGTLGLKPLAGMIKELGKEVIEKRAGAAWALLVKACDGLYAKFPDAYRQELEATAKAAGVDRNLLIVANCIGDVQHVGGCSVLVIEPKRSATGEVLFGRNADTMPLHDLGQYGLVIVRRPAGKRAFVSVAFPGVLVCGSEMNDAGLCLGTNDVRETKDGSPKLDPEGTPFTVLGRRLMEECATVADAEKLLKGVKATTTGSAIVCDTKSGVVFEVTPKNVRARRAEEGLVRCTNHFRDPTLATSLQCRRYEELAKRSAKAKWTVADVTAALHAVNQQEATVQSLVFEPAARRLHVAMGTGPVTKGPYKELDLGPLFKSE